jgi:hypothetical protein
MRGLEDCRFGPGVELHFNPQVVDYPVGEERTTIVKVQYKLVSFPAGTYDAHIMLVEEPD